MELLIGQFFSNGLIVIKNNMVKIRYNHSQIEIYEPTDGHTGPPTYTLTHKIELLKCHTKNTSNIREKPSVLAFVLKMEPTCSSETSVCFQWTTRSYIPENGTHNITTRPRSLPSKSIPVHHSSIILSFTLYSLHIGSVIGQGT
jgi:hypothetical protein